MKLLELKFRKILKDQLKKGKISLYKYKKEISNLEKKKPVIN